MDWLGNLFSNAVFLGNGLMAIVSGLVAQYLAQFLGMGPVSPFDAAIVVLLIGAAIIATTWTENYGDNAGRQTLVQQFKHAADLIKDGMFFFLTGGKMRMFASQGGAQSCCCHKVWGVADECICRGLADMCMPVGNVVNMWYF